METNQRPIAITKKTNNSHANSGEKIKKSNTVTLKLVHLSV